MHQVRTLSNGIRVVSESIEYVKSVSIGVWIGNGSRNEDRDINGISHYIEHMMFKGTQKRSAYQIAWEMDSVGGIINAFTGREHTCYYTQTLNTHTGLAIDILSDMLFSSLFDSKLMDLERQVIIEEINMYDDNPEELVYELINSSAWGNASLGMPVLGMPETLDKIDSAAMRSYIADHYTAGNIVIAVSGNFDEELFKELEDKFGKMDLKTNAPAIKPSLYSPQTIVKQKDIGQAQVILGFEGIDTYDDQIYSLFTINNILGNGMSSRLFQNIREKKGLVYSIYSSCMVFIDSGMFYISFGTNPENVEQVCGLISEEINEMKRSKIADDAIKMTKEQLKGNYILSCESIGARMQSAGRNMLLGKKIQSQEEVLDKINAVSAESVSEMIDRIFIPETLCIAAVGSVDAGIRNMFEI